MRGGRLEDRIWEMVSRVLAMALLAVARDGERQTTMYSESVMGKQRGHFYKQNPNEKSEQEKQKLVN